MNEPSPVIRPIKRVFLDIEVSPNIGLFWEAGWKVMVGHNAIVKERAVMCVCWKVEGCRQVKALEWDMDQDDRQLLIDLFSDRDIREADEVIAHFGMGFDVPWLRTRLFFHKLDPMPLFKVVDTKAWATKNFKFNSDKLDYIAGFSGHGHKIKTDYDWWKETLLDNNRERLAQMIHYCKKDVTLLEQVWSELVRYVPAETHAGVTAGLEKWTCPRTGSKRVVFSKRRVTATGQVRYQMQSIENGGYYSITQQAYDQYKQYISSLRSAPKARHS